MIPLTQIISVTAHDSHHIIIVLLIGIIVGFLSGLLGKGGSAITTPALQIFAGISPFFALASPLPASLSNSLSGSAAYKKEHLINKRVVVLTILTGIPATLAGAFISPMVGGKSLMVLTAIFVCGLGLSFVLPLFFHTPQLQLAKPTSFPPVWKVIIIAVIVGALSGLLANGGGVLFAPLFIRVLKLPTKEAMASSLLVAGGLALPGTLAHWWLGHIDWWIVLLLCIGSVPSAYLGAKVAIRLKNSTLELIFGIMLCVFGLYDLYFTL
ncbi:MAG TPA: sulfite exporter TauE/SafE family protein [Chitinophagaceae bacterium]|nr:sulfite exporter TauE/SafE family protein [Chitinophagaceae bacterium]